MTATLETTPAWTNVGVSYGSTPFLIDGVDVWQHRWQPDTAGRRVSVIDPVHGQSFRFAVQRIVADGREIVFAAGEFSNNVWGFYLPTGEDGSVRATRPPPAAPAVADRRPLAGRLAPYVPLLASLIELPWVVLVTMMAMGTRENAGPPSPYWERQFSFFLVLPAAAGLIVGLVVLLRGTAKGRLERVALAIGWAACAAFAYGFGRGMFAPVSAAVPIVP